MSDLSPALWNQGNLKEAEGLQRETLGILTRLLGWHDLAVAETLSAGLQFAKQRLPELASRDLGDGWMDWVFARTLLDEAKTQLRCDAANEWRKPKACPAAATKLVSGPSGTVKTIASESPLQL
jgi:hypothetical protein